MSIRDELAAIKGGSPVLRAEDVVEWAKQNPDSEIYKSLEWDDAKAADQYRIWQARRLIAIHVVDEEGERKFISLSIDRTAKGGGYRDIQDIMVDPERASVMLSDALADLRRTRAKYNRLKSLAPVWNEIDKADAKYGRAANDAALAIAAE